MLAAAACLTSLLGFSTAYAATATITAGYLVKNLAENAAARFEHGKGLHYYSAEWDMNKLCPKGYQITGRKARVTAVKKAWIMTGILSATCAQSS